MVSQVSARRVNAPRKGLLDGGATHPLRTVKDAEWETARPTTVEMAVGTLELRVSPLGTILTRDDVIPICPLGMLVEKIGCRVDWTAGQCRVTHPVRGLIRTTLEGNCPVVEESLCLDLIEELENHQSDRLQQALAIRALNLGVPGDALEIASSVWGDERELIDWLRDRFGDWPEHLMRRALPVRCDRIPEGSHSFLSLNRRHRRGIEKARSVILHLFPGRDTEFKLDGLGSRTVVIRIDEQFRRDLLDEKSFAWLAALCSSGKVSAVLACPPSDTFKKVWGEIGDNSGLKNLRDETKEGRFGVSTNSKPEQEKTDDHTVILLRTMILHHLANKARLNGCLLALQHPVSTTDPVRSGPSSGDCGWWNWPEFEVTPEESILGSDRAGWFRAGFESIAEDSAHHTAIFTNSWLLYTALHATVHVEPRHKNSKNAALVKWLPSVLRAVGSAVQAWDGETVESRETKEEEEKAALRVLTKEEREFREHCEKDHILFRKDCKVCLQAAMRGPKHIRQKYQHSNALCLSLDLIGPWIKGRDHSLTSPARFILVATLGVPLLRDGSPLPLSADARSEKEERQREEGERKSEKEEKQGEEGERERRDGVAEDHEDDGGGIGEWILEDEAEEEKEAEDEMSEGEYQKLCDDQENQWREIAKGLKEPVELHELTFAEPLTSKKAAEVLRGVHRVYAKIRMLNLEVRRTHSDGGREFTNRQFRAWCSSRDIHPTYSTPGDPKGNGRIESAVGRIKAGVRALLLSAPELSRDLWPSALRQHVEQRFRHSAQLLGAEPPKRPLPPFGSKVTVQSRNWSRKTPYAPRAVSGITLCPAANISGATVVLVPGEEGEESKFHVAPVMYREVKDQVEFEAEEIEEELPPPALPGPAPSRRIKEKRHILAHVHVEGESGSDGLGPDALDAPCSNSESPEPERPQEKDRVRLCNLWGKAITCNVCEEDNIHEEDGCCVDCGVWHGESYSLEKSEKSAESMLRDENQITRESIEQLLAKSLTQWSPKTRKCDAEACGAKGWTLGSYTYGNQVGVTKETTRRPLLTSLLNRYLRQLDPEGTWAAIRVTCNFASELHTDRNCKGSLNFFAPISRFGRGRIWIEGAPGPGEKGVDRKIDGVKVVGRWIGGDQAACWFDASKRHAVETADGDRRVLVSYTPRLLERLCPEDVGVLRGCGFPLPHHVTSKPHHVTSEPHHVTSEPHHVTSKPHHVTSEPHHVTKYVESAMDQVELEQLQHEHFALRKFMMEQQRYFQEEVGTAASQGREVVTKPFVELRQWIEDAENWILWQSAEQQLQSKDVSQDERVVLNARLKSLGVASEVEFQGEQSWLPLSEDEDPRSGGVGERSQENSEVYPNAWGAEPAQPLQTVSVSHSEVLKNIEQWKDSISDELSNVFDVHGAMRKRTEEELQALRDAGTQIEILPGKALFHLKGGTGRHKCRVVACGNFSENAKTKGRERKLQCYAGGADSLSLRCHLRIAGHRALTHQWRTSIADIRTAFLLAPLREKTKRTFLRPPAVLKQAGFAAEGEYWEITGALYGMQESPADWASYRDETLPTIDICCQGKTTHLVRSNHEPNMWLLRCPETSEILAILSIYVDDLLLSGTPETCDAIWTAIKAKWKISEPEYADLGRAVTFCGFEIRQEEDGIHIGQAKYVQSLLDKYTDIQGMTTCPYAKENECFETKPQASLDKLRRAQALVGEMLWLATRTRIDLAFGVSRIGQLITKDVDQAIQRAEDMIKYLRITKNQELIYGSPGKGHGPGDQLPVERSFDLIEVFADASFCPGTDRSQSGIILMWGNAPVGWMSMRQPCASLSTAEAELQSSLDGMTLAEGLHGMLAELAEAPQKTFLYNDNVGACTVLTLPQGAWRTRHLRLKAAWFLEQLEYSKFRIYHVPGQYMLGDLCTKSLVGNRVKEILKMMNIHCEPSSVDGGESHALKRLKTAVKANENIILRSNSGSGGAGRALRALTAASSLHCVLSKIVKVQVEVDQEAPDPGQDVVYLLKLACGVLLLVGVTALLAWRCVSQDIPRIRVVREQPDDESEWSVVRSGSAGSEEDEDIDDDRVVSGEGLRNRARNSGCGSRSLTVPVPLVPSGSSTTHDRRDEDEGLTGWNASSSGCGSRSLAIPAPQLPSGSSDDDPFRRRKVDGAGNSATQATGLQPTVSAGRVGDSGAEVSATVPILENDVQVGTFVQLADDGLFYGEQSTAEQLFTAEETPGDVQTDLDAEEQTALVARLAEPYKPVVYPGWQLWVPPRFAWGPDPEWGGPEGNFHQRIPVRLRQDFWFIDRRRGVVVRFHAKPRRKLFIPGPAGWPEGLVQTQLTGRRRTLAMLQAPDGREILEDDWSTVTRPTRQLDRQWTGRTEFELR